MNMLIIINITKAAGGLIPYSRRNKIYQIIWSQTILNFVKQE